MDENVKIETERQTQCQIAPAHIQSYNLNKLEDHSQNEGSCTILKMSQNEMTETSIKKISTQLSERLNLECASPSNFKEKHTKKGVNGIVNGFDNCQHNISNGTTEDSDKSSSHFEKCEISSNPASNPESEFSKPTATTTTTTKCDEFANCTENREVHPDEIHYVSYESELQMPDIMRLIQKDLSEPYSIYTYRYFIHNWPKLCFLAMHKNVCVGAIVCKLDIHRKVVKRGYIAMLAVDEKYRNKKIGSNLVLKAIRAMIADEADEVVLETEITNRPALQLYENLGFVRDKRLFRYYLNGVDALRLKLWLR